MDETNWFPTRDAMDFLNQALDLPATGQEQDWDIELADPDRAAEFVAYFGDHEHELDREQKRALMALILASFDHMLPYPGESAGGEGIPPDLWAKVQRVLQADRATYADLLDYWVSASQRYTGAQEVDPECDFRISPLLRSL